MLKRLITWSKQNEIILSTGFFSGGVVFDLLTLGRIDDPFNFLTLFLYLFLSLLFLIQELRDKPFRENRIGNFLFEWRHEIAHFLLGALLSAYAIFYLKSASFAKSVLFLGVFLVLLIVNEMKMFQRLGGLAQSLIFSLCLFSYFLTATATVLGASGPWIFYTSLLITIGTVIAVWRFLIGRIDPQKLKKLFLIPALSALSIVLFSYWLRILPPLPLSVQHLGIYHQVDKKWPEYHTRRRFRSFEWLRGVSSEFQARPGDRVYVFVRVFSPGGFDDKVYLHWQLKTKLGLKTSDRIPLDIRGGREHGFRGFAYKANYVPGQWRVSVETKGGLEIARNDFEIVEDTEKSAREWKARVF